MCFNYSFIRRYFLLLAALLCAFALFALFASKYLVADETFLVVFFRGCTFFGTPLVAFAVIKVFAEEKDDEGGKAQQNMCLLLALLTIVISGGIFSL